ncbi:hypothetical protein [Natrinema salaciae]|nr:hypothetical protein [Natrinema salaciae]
MTRNSTALRAAIANQLDTTDATDNDRVTCRQSGVLPSPTAAARAEVTV